MSRTIVILGATGIQGSSVVDSFVPLSPGWTVKAVTRNPDSAAAKSLASRGVEVVKADTGDLKSITRAFVGATAIFAVTGSGCMVTPPERSC